MTSNTAATESATETDAVLETLANERRRVILRSLQSAPREQRSVDALVDDVAEAVCSEDTPTETLHRRIGTELHHSHLPALEEMEMIVHDREEDVVWSDVDESTRELLGLIEEYEADR